MFDASKPYVTRAEYMEAKSAVQKVMHMLEGLNYDQAVSLCKLEGCYGYSQTKNDDDEDDQFLSVDIDGYSVQVSFDPLAKVHLDAVMIWSRESFNYDPYVKFYSNVLQYRVWNILNEVFCQSVADRVYECILITVGKMESCSDDDIRRAIANKLDIEDLITQLDV